VDGTGKRKEHQAEGIRERVIGRRICIAILESSSYLSINHHPHDEASSLFGSSSWLIVYFLVAFDSPSGDFYVYGGIMIPTVVYQIPTLCR